MAKRYGYLRDLERRRERDESPTPIPVEQRKYLIRCEGCHAPVFQYLKAYHESFDDVRDVDADGKHYLGLHSCSGSSVFAHSAGAVDSNRRRH